MRPLLPALILTAVLAGGVAGILAAGRGGAGGGAPGTPDAEPGAVLGLAGRVADRYRRPATGEARRLAAAFSALAAGRTARAADLAAPLGYRIRHAPAAWVLEPRARGRAVGWGLFAHAPSARDGLVIEVPHPRSDRLTEEIGARLFAAARAEALLVAGARREAVDVAHDRSSPFAVVSAALARPDGVHVQIHGFDDSAHPVGDVVVSSGRARPDPAAVRVAAGFRRDGYEVCLYTGGRCSALAARTNVQQISAHAAGAQFVHVELAPRLRDDARARRRVVQLLARGLVPEGSRPD